MSDYISLKWGTLKSWKVESDGFKTALQAYFDNGEHAVGAMMQNDSPEQIELLCEAILACKMAGGTIFNEWTGEEMTAAQAQIYIHNYDRVSVHGAIL